MRQCQQEFQHEVLGAFVLLQADEDHALQEQHVPRDHHRVLEVVVRNAGNLFDERCIQVEVHPCLLVVLELQSVECVFEFALQHLVPGRDEYQVVDEDPGLFINLQIAELDIIF